MTTPDSEGRNRGWSGVASALLYIAGFMPLGELLGSFGDSDATFVAYFDKSSNRVGALLGGIGVALASVTFFWFLSNLRLGIDATMAGAAGVHRFGVRLPARSERHGHSWHTGLGARCLDPLASRWQHSRNGRADLA